MTEIDTLAILQDLCGDQVTRHHDLYQASNVHREEHGAECGVHPSSPEDAPLWAFLAEAVGARRFLEVGCGLGYSAALMAEAAGTEGHVDTIEASPLHADLAEGEMRRRGLDPTVHVRRGEARDLLPELTEPYDVIFVDADWREYPDFLPHLTRLTRPGGVLVSANLFPLFEEWAQEAPHKDAVREYLRLLVRDPAWRTYIIPGRWQALSYRR